MPPARRLAANRESLMMKTFVKRTTMMLLAAALALPMAAQAVNGNVDKELDKVRKQINKKKSDVATKEKEKAQVKKDLAEISQEVKKSKEDLRLIEEEKNKSIKKLEELQGTNQKLETQINSYKANVSRLINAKYRNNKPDALILLLQNTDPNEKFRQLAYMKYITEANKSVINTLANQKDELVESSKLIKDELGKIEELYKNQLTIINGLNKKQQVQLKKQYNLVTDISAQMKQLEKLRSHEKELSGVLQNISNREADYQRSQGQYGANNANYGDYGNYGNYENYGNYGNANNQGGNWQQPQNQQYDEGYAPFKFYGKNSAVTDALKNNKTPSQQPSYAQGNAQGQPQGGNVQTIGAPGQGQQQAGGASFNAPGDASSQAQAQAKMAEEEAKKEASTAQAKKKSTNEYISVADFNRLQGRMRHPVSGPIIHRFGSKKAGGGVWQGVFIQNGGQSVRAVAPGKVAYAGYLRGYGDMVILLHNNSYISIYAGFAKIGVKPGQIVKSGQSLGTSGQSDDLTPMSGLYFEIRYQNKALNSQNWLE